MGCNPITCVYHNPQVMSSSITVTHCIVQASQRVAIDGSFTARQRLHIVVMPLTMPLSNPSSPVSTFTLLHTLTLVKEPLGLPRSLAAIDHRVKSEDLPPPCSQFAEIDLLDHEHSSPCPPDSPVPLWVLNSEMQIDQRLLLGSSNILRFDPGDRQSAARKNRIHSKIKSTSGELRLQIPA